MTIYEKALKEIYAAYDQLIQGGSREEMLNLWAVITVQRMITGDPNGKQPVGLIHGESPIKTVMRELETANRAIKNGRNP